MTCLQLWGFPIKHIWKLVLIFICTQCCVLVLVFGLTKETLPLKKSVFYFI